VPVFALWSAPRARSTAFFRSMLERGDLLTLHEPLEGQLYFGDTEIDGQVFESTTSLLTWLRDQTAGKAVFIKETTEPRVLDLVMADHRFLRETRFALLIRRPEEIAASLHAMQPDIGIAAIGLEALYDLYTAVCEAGGPDPVIIDSDDLVDRPAATMSAYCAAVGLPFIPQAITWPPGERPEWRRSSRWHKEVSASSGFERRARSYARNVDIDEELNRFAVYHRPFYDKLHARRLPVP
jgi:hypothetical protein